MNNNLGRDQVWNPDVWKVIDKAVLDEVGRIRVVQKVFQSSPSPSPSNVPADAFDREKMTIAEGKTKPFIEISIEFSLTNSQVNDEATLRTGRTLAKMATKSLALAEDKLFLQGAKAKLDDNIKVVNRDSAEDGLLGEATGDAIEVKLLNPVHDGISAAYGEETFKAVTKAISELNSKGQPGPYALLLESSVYADTFAPLPTTLVTTADRLTPLLTGGFYGTGTLPPNTGLLVSLGGEPTTLYVGQDAITAYTQEDKNGNFLFRVFERVQFVARDKRAFVRLAFQQAQRADEGRAKAKGAGD